MMDMLDFLSQHDQHKPDFLELAVDKGILGEECTGERAKKLNEDE